MSLTVSIVCHKTPLIELEKALECLLKNDQISDIFIMDNSPDDSLKSIYFFSPKIRYCHIENKGFGNGHNIAIKEILKEKDKNNENISFHYHLVMNADIYWEGDILNDLLKYMDNDLEIGLVTPKIYYPDGDLQYNCRKLPSPADVFLKRFVPEQLIKKRMEEYLLKAHNHDYEINCPYLLGSFLFFRLKALKEVGLFDERFFMYPEDIDISRRMHKFWKTMYWPGVKIVHEHKAASRKSYKMLAIHSLNMVKYFNKWGWINDKTRIDYNQNVKRNITYQPQDKREKGRG